MDCCLPPLVRDNYYFMYPFYQYWFAGSPDIAAVINFKEVVQSMNDQELASFYGQIRCRANTRPTDCSEESLLWVTDRLGEADDIHTLLDVGCGRGFCLERFARLGYVVTGCDVAKQLRSGIAPFVAGSVERLPFADNSFDVVTCFHTAEHVRNLTMALEELKRVARQHLFVIVPCQRYFRYTLDLHIHFFYSSAYFASFLGILDHECELVGGDIVYHARLSHTHR
jgi:SAM-dependent methyltransferase